MIMPVLFEIERQETEEREILLLELETWLNEDFEENIDSGFFENSGSDSDHEDVIPIPPLSLEEPIDESCFLNLDFFSFFELSFEISSLSSCSIKNSFKTSMGRSINSLSGLPVYRGLFAFRYHIDGWDVIFELLDEAFPGKYPENWSSDDFFTHVGLVLDTYFVCLFDRVRRPNQFGVYWGGQSFTAFVRESFVAQFLTYNACDRVEDPRLFLWLEGSYPVSAVTKDALEYGYDVLYSDYSPKKGVSETPPGKLFGMRTNPLDSRGFLSLSKCKLARVDSFMGWVGIQHIALHSSSQYSLAFQTISSQFHKYLKLNFWFYFFKKYYRKKETNSSLKPISTKNLYQNIENLNVWGCNAVSNHSPEGYSISDTKRLSSFGNFTDIFPGYSLIDASFYSKKVSAYNYNEGTRKIADFKYVFTCVDRVSLDSSYLLDFLRLQELTPIFFSVGDFYFFWENSLYFWNWALWAQGHFSALYFDELVLNPKISLEEGRDLLDIFKKIKILSARWATTHFTGRIFDNPETQEPALNSSWLVQPFSVGYVVKNNIEYLANDLISSPKFKKNPYTLLDYAKEKNKNLNIGFGLCAPFMRQYSFSDGFFYVFTDLSLQTKHKKLPMHTNFKTTITSCSNFVLIEESPLQVLLEYKNIRTNEARDISALALARRCALRATSLSTGLFSFDKDPELGLKATFRLLDKNRQTYL